MGTETDMTMKQTADGIVGSYDTRIAALGNLTSGVHETLNDLAAASSQRHEETNETLNDLASNRKKSSKEQSAALRGFTTTLTRGVTRMLREFQTSHNAMATELTASLCEFSGNRVAEATEQTASRKQFVTGIEKEVSGLLKGFAQNYKRMSRKLHSDLDDYVSAIAKETRGLMSGFRHENQATRSTWSDLTKTMAARRNGEQTAPKAPRRTHPRRKEA